MNRICRKTLALAFLPCDVITSAFTELEGATDEALISQHLQYGRHTWIESSVWPPSAWSVYRQPVRTNKDVEGWHHRINVKAGHSRLNLYQMLQLLHGEALLVEVNVRLLSAVLAVLGLLSVTVCRRTFIHISPVGQTHRRGLESHEIILQAHTEHH